ncbi:MAG: RluA family pseudouridine synthase [Arcobacteraceae bacterium]|nr:RluA family pseudouridine synthase [Arcobacteraceae bacterium]
MPFILKKFKTILGQKVQFFLQNEVGLSISQSQKLLAKGRIFDENHKKLQNGQILHCEYINVALFEGHTRGLKPIFTTKDFAIFDKPSGIMVHPISRDTKYTLLDEIRYHFGEKANLAHRIDLETSGLVLITRNRLADIELKTMFENREYIKKYLALVKGKIDKDIKIDTPITKDGGMIGVKMKVDISGKESTTLIKPLKYDENKRQTLVEATTLTGRQHQIRVHLDSIGHTIVGDPIYGVDEVIADKYLNKELSKEDRMKFIGHDRLMLHALYLAFEYDGITYKTYSKQSFP